MHLCGTYEQMRVKGGYVIAALFLEKVKHGTPLHSNNIRIHIRVFLINSVKVGQG